MRNLVLALVAVASCTPLAAQDFRAIKPGVEYAEMTRDIGGLKVNINLLRLDLTKVRLDVVHANDGAIGVDLTSNMAKKYNAIAAINAGFFRLDKSQWLGDAAGILQIDGTLLSEERPGRIQLFINNKPKKTEVYIARVDFSESVKIGRETLSLTGINRERKPDDLVMYTPEFGPTTLTGNDGFEVVVLKHRIASVSNGTGNSVIPRDGFVLSASGGFREKLSNNSETSRVVTIIREAAGDRHDIQGDPMAYPSQWDITNGVPQLVRDGKADVTWELEKAGKSFVDTRHPRTAVAKLKDGRFLMMTVDGRSESSGGIGLYDLASLMIELGAVDAMNLDGGGSTTMYLDGKVVNHPSDKEGERKVSDAIIVRSRNGKN